MYANPQPSADGLARLYRDRPGAQGLDQYYAEATSPVVLAGYDLKLARLAAILGRAGRLLDFGCGAGYLVERAAGRGWDAHGVELGHWAAKAAAARGVANIHIGDLAEIGFQPGSFDAVWTSQVLEHLPLPLEQLSALHRLLRPGGLLYADVPNYRTLPELLDREDWYMNHPPQHLNYFTAGSVQRLLSQAGFEVLALASEGGLKWELLLGRPVQYAREKPAARQRNSADGAKPGSHARGPAAAALTSRLVGTLDRLARHWLYDRLRLGVVLTVIARRP